MPMIDREGIFKATPMSAGLEKADSGAWAVVIKWRCDEMLIGSAWQDWSQYDQHVYSRTYFVKKDGSPSDRGVETLRDVLGWNGDVDGIATWTPPRAQLVVKPDEYNGTTRYRAEWINPIDHQGGGVRSAEADDVTQLKVAMGPTLRALFGTKAATVPAPAGKPAAPKTKLPPPPAKKAPGMTRDAAWEEYVKAISQMANPYDDATLAEAWTKGCLSVGPDESAFSATEWQKVVDKIGELLIPF